MVEATKPKRTRTNVKQSKFGCFTCKYDTCFLVADALLTRSGLGESSAMRVSQLANDA